MFHDNEIASKVSTSKTKCGYFISFGISPYIKDSVIKFIKASPFFTVLFDESLNEMLQIEQMDIYVRYYDQDKGIAVTRYLETRFF